MRILNLPVLALTLVVALAGTAFAGEKAGVKMPDSIEVAGKKLALNGMGLREATWLDIDVYVAGLYLETVSSDAAKIISSVQVKRLTLKFVRDVDRGDIVKAWREGFKNNATVKVDTLKPLIDKLNSWMSDFDDGHTLTFTYVPDTGLEVNVNGKVKGTLKGADFANSLFAIWLGPKPPNKGLKKGLLGKH
ncbi:MAG: chalcone isomerase family protein [Kofleriaceae bacterium]